MTDLDEALALLHRDDRESTRSLRDVRAKVLEAASGNVVPMRRRRFMPVAVAAAAVAVVAAGVVVVQANDAAPQAPPAAAPASSAAAPTSQERTVSKMTLVSAKDALTGAASRIKTTDQPVPPGKYRLITETGTYGRGVSFGSSVDDPQPLRGGTWLLPQTTKTWIPSDVTGEWVNRRAVTGEPKWLGGNVSQQEAAYSPSDTDTGERRGACGDFFPKSSPKKVCGDPADWDSPAFYAALPREPKALYGWLSTATSAKGSTPQAMFGTATEILRAGLMPADLRAEWYRAIAKIDGVVLSEGAVTIDGRTGTGITLADKLQRTELVIDQETGDFIGQRTLVGPETDETWLPEGTVTMSVAITSTVVDSVS
ncbi:CU044_5270 family protein [Lentzea sp. NPDC060358]|uniref:CU044_5270 family protein n=1 Tax=Lentzea sp. NPDC060358 TaxID=3347103 RepID=UPI003653A33F